MSNIQCFPITSVNILHDVYAKATILTQREVTQPEELTKIEIELQNGVVSCHVYVLFHS